MSRLGLFLCVLCVFAVSALGSGVDCGVSSCDAVPPTDEFQDLQLPQAPSFLERGAASASTESESVVDAEMETEEGAAAENEGELMGEFEGSVELEGEATAEQEAEAMNSAIQEGMAKAMNKIQAGASAEGEAEQESESESESESEDKSAADAMRFARRPATRGKTTPLRRRAGAHQPAAPWPKPVVHHAGGSPFDVRKLTPRTVNVDGKNVKLPAPIVIHQLKGGKASDRAAPVDADDPCYDVCHFNGGWSTAPCQQCIFRGITNGWVLHAIHDGIVGYNYAHWGRNQCSKKDNPFHSHAFSDCFFNTIHAACNQ